MSTEGPPRAPSPRLSVVIASRNATPFLPMVLESIARSGGVETEVIVVDDASTDGTATLAEARGARVVRFDTPQGAAVARNAGARAARGQWVLFTDHDCCMREDTIPRLLEGLARHRGKVVVGGTYSTRPHDAHRFASRLQSLHVHYSETRRPDPDYIASHCLAMERTAFLEEGGFPEGLSRILPNGCCQDVLFCHALRQKGYRLVVDPSIQVVHIFNFTLAHSVFNAFWKSRAWTRVALAEGSLLRDSGSASSEMKASALLLASALAAGILGVGLRPFAVAAPLLALASVLASARFYRFVRSHEGWWFTVRAVGLYSVQLLAILLGGLVGAVSGPLRPRD